MSIYLDDKIGSLYKGTDFKPVNFYMGNKKAGGWKEVEQTGKTLEFNNTYNDHVLSAKIKGSGTQTQTVQGINIFDITKFANAANYDGVDSSYKYKKVYWDVTKRYAIRSFLKAGATQLTGLYLTYTVGSPNPNTAVASGGNFKDIINNGVVQDTFILGQTSGLQGYISYYPSTYDISQILSVYDIEIAQLTNGNIVNYDSFVPPSPSPEYPSYPVFVTNPTLNIYNKNHENIFNHTFNMTLRGLLDGTHEDYDILSGTLPRNIAVKTFDQNSGWSYTSGVGGAFLAPFGTAGACADRTTMLCTHFKPNLLGQLNPMPDLCIYAGEGAVGAFTYVYITYRKFGTNVNALKSWLASNPFTVYYKKVTATTENATSIILPTFPIKTTIECSADVMAKVRVTDI